LLESERGFLPIPHPSFTCEGWRCIPCIRGKKIFKGARAYPLINKLRKLVDIRRGIMYSHNQRGDKGTETSLCERSRPVPLSVPLQPVSLVNWLATSITLDTRTVSSQFKEKIHDGRNFKQKPGYGKER
jgi:hypothetical protein